MRLPLRLASSLLTLMLTACTSIDVSTQHDGSAAQAVKGYRTYAWMARPTAGGPPPQGGDAISHVETSVDGFLTARGYRRVEASATPDFLIKWGGAIRDLQVRQEDDSPPPVGPMQNPYEDPRPRLQPRTYLREFSKGELDLDIVDASTKKLVWRGTAKGSLNKDSTPAEEQQWLNRAVEKLLSDFAPQPVKD